MTHKNSDPCIICGAYGEHEEGCTVRISKYEQFLNDALFGLQGYEKEIKLAESAPLMLKTLKEIKELSFNNNEVFQLCRDVILKAED